MAEREGARAPSHCRAGEGRPQWPGQTGPRTPRPSSKPLINTNNQLLNRKVWEDIRSLRHLGNKQGLGH